MAWTERTAANIFPLSREKYDLKKALSEWTYADVNYDIGYAEEICQLCDHENIRYRFEITNRYNGNALLIGSNCILKYSEIGVAAPTGERLGKADAKKKVQRDARNLITKSQTNSILGSLVRLSRVEGEKLPFVEFMQEYAEKGAFGPKKLFATIFRLEKNKILYVRRYFKMTLRTNRAKEQIEEMELSRIGTIWDCLRSSQKEIVRRLRDDIPRTKQWE